MRAPCKGCDIRRVGCHVWCHEYKDYRAKMDVAAKARKKEMVMTNFAMEKELKKAKVRQSFQK